jgi:hypothetical protein
MIYIYLFPKYAPQKFKQIIKTLHHSYIFFYLILLHSVEYLEFIKIKKKKI